MYQVRLLKSRVAQTNGITAPQRKGALVDVSLREAYRMIDAGQAEATGELPDRPEPEQVVIQSAPVADDDEDGPAINDQQIVRGIVRGDVLALDLPSKIIDALVDADIHTTDQLKAALEDGSIDQVSGIGKMAIKQIILAIQRHETDDT